MSVSSYSSDSTLSEVISVITSIGSKFVPSVKTRYVCHTTSIPLSTVIDDTRSWIDTQIHYKHGSKGSPCCESSHCMYVKKRDKNQRYSEYVQENCPCLEAELEIGVDLEPLCFLDVLRKTSSNLTRNEESIKHDEIMFCRNSASILDSDYPARLRRIAKATGFDKIKYIEQVLDLLDQLYWYRVNKKRIEPLIKKVFSLRGFDPAIAMIKQVLFTINGCLIKKFLALAPEITSYERIASQTASLFVDLLKDYNLDTIFVNGQPVEPENTSYQDIKDMANFIKRNFTKQDPEERFSAITYHFKHSTVRNFFQDELKDLASLISKQWTEDCDDYTKSLSWYYRCSILAQTRVIGYLPRAISEAKASYYREVISRFPEKINSDEVGLIYRSVIQEFRDNKIPEFILYRSTDLKEELQELFREIISNLELVVKPSASVKFTVLEGGKLEDARRTLTLARQNQWLIPIRDLDSFRIKETFKYEGASEGDINFAKPIFWISLQLAINRMVGLKCWNQADYYPLKGSEDLEKDFFKARILHVQEPGKDRNLTKGSAHLAWFLNLAGKLGQAIIGQLPEHKVGLLGSSHGWKHGRRLSGLSEESNFIYNRDGMLREEFLQFYSDWTESTDFIIKPIGSTLLKAVADYGGFPEKYKQLVLRVIVQPQPVDEVVVFRGLDEGFDMKIPWKGKIRDGYMMGNPVTKTILHACHIAEISIAKKIMQQFNLDYQKVISPALPDLRRLNKENILVTTLQGFS
jgi:hypothetical protein